MSWVAGRRTPLALGLGVVLVVALIAVLVGRTSGVDSGDGGGAPGPSVAAASVAGPPDAKAPQLDAEALVAGVQNASVAELTPVRLASGLVPPTNRWFSGLVFGDQPQPVYPRPLSVAFTGPGLSIGLPDPVTTDAGIAGPHVPAVTVDAGASSMQVTGYDSASVTVGLFDDAGQERGRVVLAEGSPFVSLTADEDGAGLTVATDVGFAPDESMDAGAGHAVATVEINGRTWVVVAPDGALDSSATGLALAAGESATWYPMPDDDATRTGEVLARAAADPVTGTELTYGVGDGIARTTIGYSTADGTPGAYVTLPHHRRGDQPERDCGLGTYPSVDGTLDLCAGSQLTSFAPLREPAGALDLDGLDDTVRAQIVEQVRADVAATPDAPSDTYFGGKWLYRAATLVVLGEQLGATDDVAALREEVTAALREWAEPKGCAERDFRCFAYDPDAAGVVGLTPSFGSEEFNDHYFHYGYHLAAAGLMSADDPALAADLAPVMNLLALDIAAPTSTDLFPQLRAFDVYAGHSWASGTAPFADGNNQESSSEAVNAWNGLGLWAAASGQDELGTLAAWLMSTEEASALAYWVDLDLSDPVYEGFKHQIVSLNWGGKRDWATWFSAEPNAILGIQLIPMGPFADYVAADPERVRAAVAEATPDGYAVQFGDYLLMYLSLAGPDAAAEAWDQIADLPATSVDDGNSRAYLMAWVASRLNG